MIRVRNGAPGVQVISGSVTVIQGSAFLVSGRAGDGGAPVGFSVPIAGLDLAGLVRSLRVLADGTVKAREDALPMAWVSSKLAAPAANAVGADTGALAAGDYDLDIQLAVSDTTAAGKGLVIEHRNAANAATLQNLGGCGDQGDSVQVRIRRYTLALNERIRVITGTAAGAAGSMYISAIGRRLS
jgi:hypothetical protein